MNWFDTSGLTSLAKTALKEAQKTIDKALDIQDDSGDEQEGAADGHKAQASTEGDGTPQKDNSDFFSSWGLTVSAESAKPELIQEQPVVTESPSKTNAQSMWGSFAGSFFEQPKPESSIVRPPKAKSMNLITDKYDSQDDLFSKSQLVMSDGSECGSKFQDPSKDERRRNSSISNMLSLVSSRNSSDSVEVLSQSLKSSPDSEPLSCPSVSHSSSAGPKLNSESVEILPDSLVSPSSIECLGFDSYISEKNSPLSTSSNMSPCDSSDKKLTPVGDRTERPETADSVSLVADDDEDTMSYNSISECTAPTVLDTDDKPVSPFPKIARIERSISRKEPELQQSISSQRMQISENSSNDGSWSDRTLNADNDSINMENSLEEIRKEAEQEDTLMDKLSDSSSFYNVKVTKDMMKSESSAFVNVEKQQCSATDSSESSQRDASLKERTSPISSDSKSDMVKIGSDRTSGHTSGDELETATSSDIEIIPSPNGNSSNGCRRSPGKYDFKQKTDGSTSPNLVDLVLGKSLASKIRGHNRELSEASIQSNTSDESQCSENDRLMRRLCEMAEILDARENRLIEVSRSNAELVESNASLKTQVESLIAKHEGGDISTITEDYTQRMSALEKKFQQAIREKDHLRKQVDSLKADVSRKQRSELEATLREKEEMINQLTEEGEKLARQQLQHSNIIKKLRAKEKENEQVIKGLRDKISEQTAEIERMKRSLAAKEEVEVSQIEAVYRLTTANNKLEAEVEELRSQLDDTQAKLEVCRTSAEAAKRAAGELRRDADEAARLRASTEPLKASAERAARDVERLRHEMAQLRAERAKEQQRWAAREDALRREVNEAREAGAGAGGGEEAPGALLHQLAALQRAALDRDRAHVAAHAALNMRLAEAEAAVSAAAARERAARAEAAAGAEAAAAAEKRARADAARARDMAERAADAEMRLQVALDSKNKEIEELRAELQAALSEERARVAELSAQLEAERAERAAADERRRLAALQADLQLQEPPSIRGDVSPTSVSSECVWEEPRVWAEEARAGEARRAGERRGVAAQLRVLQAERAALRDELAAAHAKLQDLQAVSEQHEALLVLYGEAEERLQELRLDLHDVTQLYKQQLDELVKLKRQAN
ncbi:TATA element modulatory factor [Aricia agestis]|uniref:TATA element modulatory factor n=1 Tax=Aricia agestis TaxID=91739 RepID=UPI001C201A32|nr:TATA element modulatory factor [Aricia agestis]